MSKRYFTLRDWLLYTLTNLYDRLLAGWHNVEYPYPGRRLKGLVSVQYRGNTFLCHHAYKKTGFHEELITTAPEPFRTSIRHYECSKCRRKVHVTGRLDDYSIEKTIARYKKQKE